jgi:hypothetical protein
LDKITSVKVSAFILLAAAAAGLMGMGAAQAQTPTPDPARYGQYPIGYREIVTKWLETKLLDPGSAQMEWVGDPQPADLGTKGQHLYGYLVKFKVNSKNRFGGYTGKQAHGALIRNGEVIKGTGFGY